MSRGDATGASHLTRSLLERYVAGGAGTGHRDPAWTVEAHLEACPACRGVLADLVERTSPQVAALLDQVGERVAAAVEGSPQVPVRGRWMTRRSSGWIRAWAAPATLPRMLMTVLVVAAALLLDLWDAGTGGRVPSLVLLVAPVAPLAGVSAAWSRGIDPAYEVVAASARAGLDLVLRRTLAVLAVVIPLLAAAGGLVGVSPAGWLLPCLAFTVSSLALGEVVGLRRASGGLAALWVAGVVGPSLWRDQVPVVLEAAGRPAWVAVVVAMAVLLAVRRPGYTRPVDLR